MRYSVVLLPEEDGRYTASVPALPGCVTFGNGVEETLERARDAIAQYVASLEAHGEPVPEEHGLPQVATVDV
jgi:antitoxin HicB